MHYPELFGGEPEWRERALSLATRVFELTEFLAARGFVPDSSFPAQVTCHKSCHLLRDLDARDQPQGLLRQVPGMELVELPKADVCCGFGGAFAVKMPELSEAMLDAKLAAVESTGTEVLTAADCGCLMHLGGALSRRRSSLRVFHVAEILAGGE